MDSEPGREFQCYELEEFCFSAPDGGGFTTFHHFVAGGCGRRHISAFRRRRGSGGAISITGATDEVRVVGGRPGHLSHGGSAGRLFFVSPWQVNYLIPTDTAAGPATVTITDADGSVSAGPVQIANVEKLFR